MLYALVENGTVVHTTFNRPTSAVVDGELVQFAPGITDAELLGYGYYPVVAIENRDVTNRYYDVEYKFTVNADNVQLQYVCVLKDLATVRTIKKADIDGDWNRVLAIGKFVSKALGITVDARRSQFDNDQQNLVELIGLGEADPSIFPLVFKGCTESKAASLDDLKALRLEMARYFVDLYQAKFDALAAIDAMTVAGEVYEYNYVPVKRSVPSNPAGGGN